MFKWLSKLCASKLHLKCDLRLNLRIKFWFVYARILALPDPLCELATHKLGPTRYVDIIFVILSLSCGLSASSREIEYFSANLSTASSKYSCLITLNWIVILLQGCWITIVCFVQFITVWFDDVFLLNTLLCSLVWGVEVDRCGRTKVASWNRNIKHVI